MKKIFLSLLTISIFFSSTAFAETQADPIWKNYLAAIQTASHSTKMDSKYLQDNFPWVLERIDANTIHTPNFAGSYKIIQMSAGTMCMAILVVDCKTGKVHKAPFAVELGCHFKIDSTLLIENPSEDINEAFAGTVVPPWVETTYYQWSGENFTKITPPKNRSKPREKKAPEAN